MEEDRMLQWFECSHLRDELQTVAQHFNDLAHTVCKIVPSGPERTVALRKLLEAKDAAVRAKIHPGG